MLELCCPIETSPSIARADAKRYWFTLWEHGHPTGVVIEDLNVTDQPRPQGILLSLPIHREIHRALLNGPGANVMDRIAAFIGRGQRISPSDDEIGVANAGHGLDILLAFAGLRTEGLAEEGFSGLCGILASAFLESVIGNRLSSLTYEAQDDQAAQMAERFGLNPIDKRNEEAGPVILSVPRQQAIESNQLFAHRLFTYFPPVLGFTQSQRDILILARQGYTDQEIAKSLGKTQDSIKKKWSGIYERFTRVFPDRLPAAREGSRGNEKRRVLLAHLRGRPEELRPYVGQV